MRVLVAMSGGVDSSVAAATLAASGHDVVGATMKLWGGDSDSGCCSVADVDDARRVAQQLGIRHHVFNFSEDLDRDVVSPYVTAHAEGRTPNPCVACNRHLKFDRLLRRASALGFDAVATGHYARVDQHGGRYRLLRGADRAKDQSYVLHMLGQDELARVLLPVGELTKAEVRRQAADLGLRTAAKPDSQDVCFVTRSGGRAGFLSPRIPLHPARLVDGDGQELGRVDAVELVTVGQRRHLGSHPSTKADRRFVVDVDVAGATVTVGSLEDLLVPGVVVGDVTWTHTSVDLEGEVLVQLSAHGQPVPATVAPMLGEPTAGPVVAVHFSEPQRRVAPGQSVVLYRGDEGLGGGTAGVSRVVIPRP